VSLELSKPILYLITPGATVEATTSGSPEFQQILLQISRAVDAGIQLIQIREKRLTAKVLFYLTRRAAELACGSSTKILVNDRADLAKAAGADGVHLTTQSLEVVTIRKAFGANFLIGASTHSLAEALAARDDGADFLVFGPVFLTQAKKEYGPPVGLAELTRVTEQLRPFPVLALGGVTKNNAGQCLVAGASGIAGISLFREFETFTGIAAAIKQTAKGVA
jgi:thiamine-phosphate pyrophosphorylase